MVYIKEGNSSFITIFGDIDDLISIKEYFKVKIPDIKFVKRKVSYPIREYEYFFNNNRLYKPLYSELIKFLDKEGIEYDDEVGDIHKTDLTYVDYENYTPTHIELYDHQKKIVEDGLKERYQIFESATGSGKSLAIYMLNKMLIKNGIKSVIVVPTILLSNQLYSDFEEYEGSDISHYIKEVSSKAKKDDIAKYKTLIITKESLKIYRDIINKEFNSIIIDECVDGNSYITMGDGSKKMIRDCEVGDKVISYNENEGIFEEDTIVKVYKNRLSSQQLYEITLDDTTIHITGNHKVLTNNGWKRVDECDVGDYIISL